VDRNYSCTLDLGAHTLPKDRDNGDQDKWWAVRVDQPSRRKRSIIIRWVRWTGKRKLRPLYKNRMVHKGTQLSQEDMPTRSECRMAYEDWER